MARRLTQLSNGSEWETLGGQCIPHTGVQGLTAGGYFWNLAIRVLEAVEHGLKDCIRAVANRAGDARGGDWWEVGGQPAVCPPHAVELGRPVLGIYPPVLAAARYQPQHHRNRNHASHTQSLARGAQ